VSALRTRPLALALLACLALAVLSLVVADQPTYDPQAWLIWGRQIAHGTLETVSGPSWKPLPVLITAPSALLGDGPPPLIWLTVARTGGFAAVVLAAVVAMRLAGRDERGRPWHAGAFAAVALLLANTYLSGVLRGNSEGLLAAAVLAAVLAVLDGRYRLAFGFGVAAALLRPEAWPALALYSLWLLHRDRSPRTLALIGGSALLVILLWFVPEKLGSGDFFRGASRAREPVAGSPAQSSFPFGAVFTNGASALIYPIYAAALLAVLDAIRRRRTPVLAVAALATLWMLAVAALAQKGFTGNLRYVMLPAALVCAIAGAGVARLPRRWPLYAVLALACVPGVVHGTGLLHTTLAEAAEDERVFDDLPRVIARAGGERAVLACGAVFTGPFQTQAVAWRLHLRQQQVKLRPTVPGTILGRIPLPITRDQRFALRVRSKRWVLRQSC
jgi:MFS family permease